MSTELACLGLSEDAGSSILSLLIVTSEDSFCEVVISTKDKQGHVSLNSAETEILYVLIYSKSERSIVNVYIFVNNTLISIITEVYDTNLFDHLVMVTSFADVVFYLLNVLNVFKIRERNNIRPKRWLSNNETGKH